jgi:hypothetical protein
MAKRPPSVTVVSILLAAAGAVGLVYHWKDVNLNHPFQNDALLVELIRLLAIISGVYMLRGCNWARWLAMAWISFHVVLGAFHSFQQFAMHVLVSAIFAFVLFRRPAAEYFRRGGEQMAR